MLPGWVKHANGVEVGTGVGVMGRGVEVAGIVVAVGIGVASSEHAERDSINESKIGR